MVIHFVSCIYTEIIGQGIFAQGILKTNTVLKYKTFEKAAYLEVGRGTEMKIPRPSNGVGPKIALLTEDFLYDSNG